MVAASTDISGHSTQRRAEPSAEACEASGDALSSRGDYAAASDEYKRALFFLGGERSPRRALLYVKLGDVARTLGKPRIAGNNYLKALGIEPFTRDAYARYLPIALSERDFDGLSRVQRLRLLALDDAGEKVAACRENAELWLEQARDLERGARALETWLELEPGSAGAAKRLAQVQVELGRHADAVKTWSALGDRASGAEAAAAFHQAGRLTLAHGGDATAGRELYLRALACDVEQRELLAETERLLADAGDHAALAELYEDVAARSRKPKRRSSALTKLAALCRGELGDPARLERALVELVELEGEQPPLLRELAEVQLGRGALEGALELARRAARAAPREAASYRLAYQLFERLQRPDGAFHAACALDYLGDAEINESLVADAHRPEGLLTPQALLGEEDWARAPFTVEIGASTLELFAALALPALEVRAGFAQRSKKPSAVADAERQDVAASTATLVRALSWATRVLGVPTPELYLRADVPGAIAAVPLESPTLLASRALGSGLELKQLAFLWARALFSCAGARRLAVAFPSPEELGLLLSAARAAVQGDPAPAGAEGKALHAAFSQKFDGSARARLASLLPEPGDDVSFARRFLGALELGATRAGLLASGDLAEAAALTERFPAGALTSPAEQIDALLHYSLSEEYAALRRRMGVAVSG